ncbi:MAG: hypothetical protein EHM14_11700, partial [Methanothrix sp.]
MSFVPSGANGKKYLLVKEMKKKDMFKKLLASPDVDFLALLEKEGIEGDAAEVVGAAATLLKAYKDELPEDVLELLAKGTGFDEPGDDDEDGEGDDGKNKKPEGEGGACKNQTDNGLSKELLAKLDPALQGLIGKLIEKADGAEARATRAEGLAKSLQESTLEKEYFTKAENLKHVPGVETKRLAKSMMVLAKDHPVEFAHVYTALTSAEALIAKGITFEEAGAGGSSHMGSVEAKIDKMAEGLINKSDEPMTKEQAICKILVENPELYEEYEAERA